MASGDLLRQLFRGYAKRDDATFRAAAESIIQEERLKNHRLLADDLERILLNGNGSAAERHIASSLHDLPKDRERGFPSSISLSTPMNGIASLQRSLACTRTHEPH